MAAFNKFNLFVDWVSKATLNLSSDALNVMLTNTAPVATNSIYSDISANDLPTGNGYTAGGSAVTPTLSNSSGTEKLVGTNVTFTASSTAITLSALPAAAATSATLSASYTGSSGVFTLTFTTASGTEAVQATFTNGSTAVSWTGGLSAAVSSTAATQTMGSFRYAVLYDSTPTTDKALIGWWDYGSSITMASGDTFTVTFDGTNGILQLA